MQDRLVRLQHTPPTNQDQIDRARADIAVLSEPAKVEFIMFRITSLLHPYYQGDAPSAVLQQIADDWATELSKYPDWAIDRAVKWYKSAENKDRRKKPLEGDISERCKKEIAFLGVAEKICDRGVSTFEKKQSNIGKVTREKADKIMKEVGFVVSGYGTRDGKKNH